MAVVELRPDVGEELVARRRSLDADEAAWLELLARFVRSQEWAVDGFLTAAHWLGQRCAMARATAYEKLRVALELDNRPLIARGDSPAGYRPMGASPARRRWCPPPPGTCPPGSA